MWCIMVVVCAMLARHEELEREQAAGKAKGEQAPPMKPVMDMSIGGSAEAKRVRRLEREMGCVSYCYTTVVLH